MSKRPERNYQPRVIREIETRLPGAMVFKGDTRYKQGCPDLIILYQDRWAMLQVKASEDEPFRPNQEYYLETLDKMSYAAVIHPGNEEDILNGLQQALEA